MNLSILVVCTGNQCRSPLGEHLLRQRCTWLEVRSAGVDAIPGRHADPVTQTLAARYGLSLEQHCASRFNTELARQHSLILVMEQHHLATITHISPESRGKTMFYGQWLAEKEIRDPYKHPESVYIHTFDLMKRACESWATKINKFRHDRN